MPNLPFARVIEAAANTPRYHFHIEHSPGLFYAGETDHTSGSQYFQLGIHSVPLAEAFWDGDTGIGHNLQHSGWRRLDGRPFPNLMHAAASSLRREAVTSVREEDDIWFAEMRLQDLPLLQNPDDLARILFGHCTACDIEQAAARIASLAETMRVTATVAIARETLQILEFTVHQRSILGEAQMRVAFATPQCEMPPMPHEELEHLSGAPALPVELLLITLPTLGGWDAPTEHGPWAQRSIQLIAEQDMTLPAADRKYAEIYTLGAPQTGAFAQKAYPIPAVGQAGPAPDAGMHHPIVLGSWHEDNTAGLPSFYATWFSKQPPFLKYIGQGGYGRYYHHFGGDGTGLKYQDYMDHASPPAPTCISGGDKRYYSARDWGFGPARLTCANGEALNRLTFQRALEQYNAYTIEGKRNAYLLLGHVVHLLQDVGEPDHAALADHAGSGMTEPQAYSTFYLCEIGAGIAAAAACAPIDIICYGITFGIAYGICEATIDKNVVGYERLISEKWHLSRVEKQIAKLGVATRTGYDAYFHDMQEAAKQALAESKVKYPGTDFGLPLGCSAFMGIPGLDPHIDMSNEDECKPYFELTDKIAPQVVALTAGFIQHFLDVANQPPYLKQVIMAQWDAPGQPQPVGFGSFANDMSSCVRYWAEWKDAPPHARSLLLHKKQYLALDRPVYVFLHFGPSGIGPTRGRLMKELLVVVQGSYPGKGPFAVAVTMQQAEDSQLGAYYWGSFTPRNCCADPYMLTLEVTGKDAGPHDNKRKPCGDTLDAKPNTMAYVDIHSASFAWLDYTPDADTCHTVMVDRFAWRLDILPLHLVIDRTRSRGTGELSVQIEQQYWDCQWEPTWGRPTCPVEWNLKPDITFLGAATTPAAPETFGIEIRRELRHAAIKLAIKAGARAQAGSYVLEIEYTLGDPSATHTLQIGFDIV
jgi:hypothetical protein